MAGAVEPNAGATPVQEWVRRRDFPSLIKHLDAQLRREENSDTHIEALLLNRGMCLQHLGLYRKAQRVSLDAVAE